MPTLRDDIIEARDRADVARKALAKKLERGQEWTRDDKIESIDGLDSMVSMAQETLPYIPTGRSVEADLPSSGALSCRTPSPSWARTRLPSCRSARERATPPCSPTRRVSPTAGRPQSGFDLRPGVSGMPDGFDKDRPNVVLNPKTGNFDFTDVDFTGDNAGSNERDFIAAALIYLPYDQWGDVEFAAVSTGDDNRVVAPARPAPSDSRYGGEASTSGSNST